MDSFDIFETAARSNLASAKVEFYSVLYAAGKIVDKLDDPNNDSSAKDISDALDDAQKAVSLCLRYITLSQKALEEMEQLVALVQDHLASKG